MLKKNILPGLKNRGKQYDQRYTDLDIANVFNNPSKVEYIGTKSGRPLVRVEMPDGFSEYFYKSSGWAGKKGDGVGGTTQGLWQPFGGHTQSMGTSDWFIKDSGYKDYYGSNAYETIAKNLDNVLVKNTGVKDVNALNKAINFRNVSGNVDTYKPDYKSSIFSKGDVNEFWHGGAHINPPRSKKMIKNIFNQYPGLYNFASPKDYKAIKAKGKHLEHLEATGRGLEYFPPGDTWYPYQDSEDVKLSIPGGKNKHRILYNPNLQNPNEALKLDIISHSYNTPETEVLKADLDSKLRERYGDSMIDRNGGVDGYIRGYLSNSEEYAPYKKRNAFSS